MSLRYRRFFLILLLTCLAHVLSPLGAIGATPRSDELQNEQVEAILQEMSPRDRVGQLFIVTFPNNDIGETSIPAQLIQDLRVGGVVLRASNQNYTNDATTPAQLVTLTNGLQALARDNATLGDTPYIPLFIAIDHLSPAEAFADGIPQGGFTQLPSPLALGATWNLDFADTAGRITGQELNAVGINLLLGPNLDLTSTLNNGRGASTTFGGNAYWVGALGQSFMEGVQAGSGNHVGVIARHFPGMGSSDRTQDDEIATVQKSSERFNAEDVLPYFAAIRAGAVDGVMTTHLRYRALQGNVRQTTRPLSLDAQSLPALLALPDVATWKSNGGIVVSDDLGAPALRRFYEQQTGSFPARTVAREAFNAGNDLLFLGEFASTDDWTARIANVEETLDFFEEQYTTDPTFAGRVDDAVRRILGLKLRLYEDDFTTATPRPDPTESDIPLLRAPENENAVQQMAQSAATLLYPSSTEIAGVLAQPLSDESIVIITDVGEIRDCSDCPTRSVIAQEQLETSLLARYGPAGTGQLQNNEQISSLTFSDLDALLTPSTETPPDPALQTALNEADWLIFLLQDRAPSPVDAESVLSQYLKTFNNQQQNRRLIVFTFGAPLVLDSTEVSKTTAYYAFYTPSPTFVDAAGQLLFQEYPATGIAPLSIPALNYLLTDQLRPDTSQVVDLCRDDPALPVTVCEPLPATLDTSVSNEIALRTGIIRDRNGHPVPDGTIVFFVLRYPTENVEQPRQRVTTMDGVARTTIVLDRVGLLAISVVSEGFPTFASTTVQILLQGDAAPVVGTVEPSPTPTEEPTATPTATITPSATATRRPLPTPTPSPTPRPWTRIEDSSNGVGWWTLLTTVVGLVMVGGVGAVTLPATRLMLVRRVLTIALYGLVGYLVYLTLYTLWWLPSEFNGWGAVFVAMMAGFVALLRERQRP
jgi:beta-N-acetylhexosaminidase